MTVAEEILHKGRKEREAEKIASDPVKTGEKPGGSKVEAREIPILFGGEMVRAILAGRKTQTRRVCKPALDKAGQWAASVHPDGSGKGWIAWWPNAVSAEETVRRYPGEEGFACPYGVEGDRLWVRETWARPSDCGLEHDIASPVYKASWPPSLDERHDAGLLKTPKRWRPSIFMPKRAKRITLENAGVRVQRVQEISEEDAKAEGMTNMSGMNGWDPSRNIELPPNTWSFMQLWNQINAKPKPVMRGGAIDHYVSYPWADVQEVREHRGKPWKVRGNPYVWAVEFRRVEEE